MFQFSGFNIFHMGGRRFKTTYRCYTVARLNKGDRVESGGKVILPISALEFLTHLNIEYPMLFKLSNNKNERTSHCGVLEFNADEGKCFLPEWMMSNLEMKEGELINVESVSLPVGTFSKFQPKSVDFLDITNPKAVLENALRHFACLTTGDVIAIKYNDRVYDMCVLETRPGPAVNIIECDMNVEFEEPLGYKVPLKPVHEPPPVEEPAVVQQPEDETFHGAGLRLDGKKKKADQMNLLDSPKSCAGVVPDYDYELGTITFDRSIIPISDRYTTKNEDIDMDTPLSAFDGAAYFMKKSK